MLINNRSIWEHTKTGNRYRVLTLTNEYATDKEKFPTSVVYQNMKNSQLFSRPKDAFVLKFTKVD